jgi:DNA-directed RNA polymerase specialized sigma24 family protein
VDRRRRRGREPFERIVERHGSMVLRICRGVAGPDAAEDAWSETFAALCAYPSLPADSKVEGCWSRSRMARHLT